MPTHQSQTIYGTFQSQPVYQMPTTIYQAPVTIRPTPTVYQSQTFYQAGPIYEATPAIMRVENIYNTPNEIPMQNL